MSRFYEFSAPLLDGTVQPMEAYRGKVVAVVNVASKCGMTPQYAGLEALYSDYGDRGFVILGFPCNQFGEQEPGSAAEIAQFCSLTYDVTFPIFAKVEVNGAGADPIYKYLRSAAPAVFGTEDIPWNFTKFLLGRGGEPIRRYAPAEEPDSMRPAIEAALAG